MCGHSITSSDKLHQVSIMSSLNLLALFNLYSLFSRESSELKERNTAPPLSGFYL